MVRWQARPPSERRTRREAQRGVGIALARPPLLPAYAAYCDPYDPLVLAVLGDHVATRGRADVLAADPTSPLEALHDLGERMAAHVRREERELFPLIERAMPAAELAALADALARAEAGA